jgi:phage host-nuclease inhibitor protein Gam
MATRQKAVVISNVPRKDAENAFEAYNHHVSKLTEIEGKMNAEITTVKSRYETQVGQLQAERDRAFDILQVYAQEHPELFEKRKSVEWTHGVFGFRTGTPKLKTLKGFTWASVLTLVRQLKPSYIRNVEELNKDLMIADREKLSDDMKKVGVEVVQDETFFVQPKLENVATA